MRITITGRNIELTEGLKAAVEERLSSTAALSPSVSSIFLPVIVILMLSNPFAVYLIRLKLYHVHIIS